MFGDLDQMGMAELGVLGRAEFVPAGGKRVDDRLRDMVLQFNLAADAWRPRRETVVDGGGDAPTPSANRLTGTATVAE